LRQLVAEIRVSPALIGYIRQLVRNSRESASLMFGAGPRAGIALLNVCKGLAAMSGRDFVTPDDVRTAIYPVLRHRLLLHPDVEIEGLSENQVIASLLESVEVPR